MEGIETSCFITRVILDQEYSKLIKFEIMEEVFMTQEAFENSIEVGEVIETDKGERLKCVSKENGVPQFEFIN